VEPQLFYGFSFCLTFQGVVSQYYVVPWPDNRPLVDGIIHYYQGGAVEFECIIGRLGGDR
jgi:hypothetical protein